MIDPSLFFYSSIRCSILYSFLCDLRSFSTKLRLSLIQKPSNLAVPRYMLTQSSYKSDRPRRPESAELERWTSKIPSIVKCNKNDPKIPKIPTHLFVSLCAAKTIVREVGYFINLSKTSSINRRDFFCMKVHGRTASASLTEQ